MCRGGTSVTREFQHEEVAIGVHDKVEVKVGSGSVIVEQSELHSLVDAISEMRNLADDGIAMMNIGSA